VVREAMAHQAKHLIAMQYSAAHLRVKALEDILSGPEHLHATLGSILPEVRALRSSYPDAQATTDVAAFPAPRRKRPPRGDRSPQEPRGMRAAALTAAAGVARQLRPVGQEARQRPQAAVPAMDARWWRLSQLDSAVVSTADGTSASWYRRDREHFTDLGRRSLALHQRLLAEWPELSRRYRAAADELVSPDAWAATFAELERGSAPPGERS
jgi:galactofuranosylgalactofuranosylrhamnosyl-N-acetylglucosaminyl-diphospho-decaprenol beta-1,5/1,6-galactofuranosyltransferase